MTTEIAIMNKSAIALAADSAATVSTNDQNMKTYNTANKVFALSKYAPVGIMIYGNANILGVPWETVVKMYRTYLGKNKFDCLEEYHKDFFDFLNVFYFPDEAEEEYILSQAVNISKNIIYKINNTFKQKKADELSEEQRNKIIKDIITQDYKFFNDIVKKSVLTDEERKELKDKYEKNLEELIKIIFKDHSINNDLLELCIEISIIASSLGPRGESGIVIAGFGEKDIFPCCCEFDVAAVLKSKTIMRKNRESKITYNNKAEIIPFAQSNDVRNFIEGIDPNLNRFLDTTFNKMLKEELPKVIIKSIKKDLKFDKKTEKEQLAQLQELCSGAYDTLFKELANRKQESYITPVVGATAFLSKSELASMAETLVSLVSFRKQVTMEAETVGGPIDVLVVTKGDGPVWIKRKHYFSPELNHHFFSNYHKTED